MAGDDHHHHDEDGHRDPPSFPIQVGPSILGFLLAFACYYFSKHPAPFTYVENDTAALAAASARGERVEWSTFDRHLVQSPKSFRQPEDLDELLAILQEARAQNETVKVVGSGHSWSPLGLTPSLMLNLDKFDKVFDIDASSKLVTVQAGIRIRDLSAALAAHDPPLALKNTGVLNRQSLAGALATGTHGTGIHYPIMSEQIRAVELVTAGGDVIRTRRDHPEKEMREVFEAAALHLGGLGIITELTLEVVEAFSVVKRIRLLPMSTVLATLPEIAAASDHVLVWWVPYTNTAQLLESNRTARGVDTCSSSSDEDDDDESLVSRLLLRPNRATLGRLQVRALSAAGWLSSRFPAATVPFTNRWLVAPALHAFAWLMGDRGAFIPEGYKGICLDDHPNQYREMEYFLPYRRFQAAFAEFEALLEEGRATLGANFVVQLRMTRRDDLWLSPFRGEDPWYVAVATLIKGFDCEPYFRRAEQIWLAHGGKPHWGKLHFLTHNELSKMYGPEFERFLAVRRRLDPRDVFLNAHLRDLFLPRATR